MNYHLVDSKQALAQLGSSNKGLSNKSAAQRLRQYGANQLHHTERLRLLKKLFEPFASAFVAVLLAGAVISNLTGNHTDSIIILVVIGINAAIEWAQQLSASRILSSLKKFSAKQVKVRRQEKIVTIESGDLVPGDIVLLGQGEKIPADGRLLTNNDLAVDESALTGESLPVAKISASLKHQVPIYKQTNMVFSGSLVVTGRAEYCVTATGNHTQLGKIAQLATGSETKAPIYEKIRRLTFQLVIATLLIGTGVIGLGLTQGYSLPEMLRFAVALIVSVIPEGLPVTLTIILLLGMWRMAKNKAFVRNLPAVETLGMITAIATDKTGTLTKNSLGIGEVWDPDGKLSLADHTDFWLSVSHRHPDFQHPIERIITQFSESKGIIRGWKEISDLPFDNQRRITAVLWQKSSQWRVYIKGAPEIILKSCLVGELQKRKIEAQLAKQTRSGMRVIAVAYKVFRHKPTELAKLNYQEFQFRGLIGFADELRAEAREAIAQTRAAGVEVYLLTGDHLETARTVASQVGLLKPGQEIVEGSALDSDSATKLAQLLHRVKVFARVLPEHKFKLLEALRKSEITAMTGDGVNDAPALAQADVGIAMGSGTDAAKEAADMVLLDDNYSTIVKAIAAGRTIYANIRKMVFYLLSTNLAEAATIVFGLLLGLPLALTAAQVLWLNIVTDTLMVVPLGLEPAEKRQMQRPPRKPTESLLSNHLVSRLVITVLVMAGISIAIFYYFLPQGEPLAQTMTFLSLVVVQWTSAFNIRSEANYAYHGFSRPNWALYGGILLGAILMALVIYGPLQTYLGTVAIPAANYWFMLPVVVLTVLTSDLHKLWVKKFARSKTL